MPDKEPLELRQAALNHLLEGEYKHYISYGSDDWREPKKSKSGNTPPLSLGVEGWCDHGAKTGGSIVKLAKQHGFDDGTSKDTSDIAARLWKDATYSGPSADKIKDYLTGKRGIPAANYEDLIKEGLLRWNKGSEKYPEPSILFPYHYLRDDKTRRLEVRKVKQTWPDKTTDRKRDLGKDGHLFIIPPLKPADGNGDIFAIEGLEDALSIRGDLVAEILVVTGGKNNLRHLERLEDSGRPIVIIADHDTNERATENGQTAAAEVQTKLKSLGVDCTAVMPEKPKTDANDALRNGILKQWCDSWVPVPELPEPPKPKRDFYLEPWSALKPTKPNWLVKGILERNTLAAVIGESGSGKSFIVVDIACCIATGTPWHGRDVQQGSVVYLAGEGRSGLIRRIGAWAHHHSANPETLMLSSRAIDLGDNHDQLPKVSAAIREMPTPPVLIVIDTLARHSSAAEASNEEMSRFINNLDTLKDEFNATVAIIHHVGKDAEKGARGPSAFKAALDHELLATKAKSMDGLVSDNTGFISLTCTKSKDAEPFAPIGFKLEAVDVLDELERPLAEDDGSPVRSCVLKESEPVVIEKPAHRPGRNQQAFIAAYERLRANNPDRKGVSTHKLRELLEQTLENYTRHTWRDLQKSEVLRLEFVINETTVRRVTD